MSARHSSISKKVKIFFNPFYGKNLPNFADKMKTSNVKQAQFLSTRTESLISPYLKLCIVHHLSKNSSWPELELYVFAQIFVPLTINQNHCEHKMPTDEKLDCKTSIGWHRCENISGYLKRLWHQTTNPDFFIFHENESLDFDLLKWIFVWKSE